MMEAHQVFKSCRWSTMGWWSIWIAAFSVSLLPPAVHHWRKIADIIEPHRYSLTHFLPAELLFLRHLGELSHWIPLALVALLILAIRKPSARNGSIAFGALVAAIFSSIYCAYALCVLSMYLGDHTHPANSDSNESEGRSN